jgi:hypothetical protein
MKPSGHVYYTRDYAIIGFLASGEGEKVDEAEIADEWLNWYRLTPQERWRESEKLWDFFLQMGGSLDPEPVSQSPFGIEQERRSIPVDGGPGVRSLRRCGI